MKPHFVSYPKSGRSWIRFILAQAGVDGTISFHHDRFEFNDGAKPAHDFSIVDRLRRYEKVDRLVYLERDPRDVMVSLFHQVTGRFADMFDYREDVSAFIRDDYFGAPTLHRFRSMWQVITSERGYLRVTYESCHSDIRSVVREILDYFGQNVSDARLTEALTAGRFENMQKIEQCGAAEQPWLRLRNGAPKVRVGRVGNFRHALGADDIRYLNDVFELPA